MTDVARVTGSGLSGTGWTMRSLEVVDDPKRQLDRLVPLLHELVAWDLVRRADDGSFVLRDDVQERLAVLSSERPNRSAQVYIGRKCEHCERVTLTRMVDGARICSTCSLVIAGRGRRHPRRHPRRPSRARGASSTGIAGRADRQHPEPRGRYRAGGPPGRSGSHSGTRDGEVGCDRRVISDRGAVHLGPSRRARAPTG